MPDDNERAELLPATAAVAPAPAATITPMGLIAAAIEKGLDPDKLEKLVALQERWDRARAEEAYAAALAQFQAECPPVRKRRAAKGKERADGTSKLAYKFGNYDDVMVVAGPILARLGITVSFDTKQETTAAIKVVVRIRVGSYYEDKEFTVPMPANTFINQTQNFGSGLSYAKRYALCAALNIVMADEDDDAQSAVEMIGEAEVALIEKLIKEKQVNLERFLRFADAGSVAQIAKKKYPKILDALHRKPTPPTPETAPAPEFTEDLPPLAGEGGPNANRGV